MPHHPIFFFTNDFVIVTASILLARGLEKVFLMNIKDKQN